MIINFISSNTNAIWLVLGGMLAGYILKICQDKFMKALPSIIESIMAFLASIMALAKKLLIFSLVASVVLGVIATGLHMFDVLTFTEIRILVAGL